MNETPFNERVRPYWWPAAGFRVRLTVFIQEELIEAQATGLLANEAVHVLGAVVVDGDGVLERLDAGLKAEWDLGISGRVPADKTHEGATPPNQSERLRCLGVEPHFGKMHQSESEITLKDSYGRKIRVQGQTKQADRFTVGFLI